MKKLLKVLRIELRETTTEKIIKSKRHNYARGGFKIEEVITRETVSTPFALLECGHWRKERHSGAVVSTAQRLECWECQSTARYVALSPSEKVEYDNWQAADAKRSKAFRATWDKPIVQVVTGLPTPQA